MCKLCRDQLLFWEEMLSLQAKDHCWGEIMENGHPSPCVDCRRKTNDIVSKHRNMPLIIVIHAKWNRYRFPPTDIINLFPWIPSVVEITLRGLISTGSFWGFCARPVKHPRYKTIIALVIYQAKLSMVRRWKTCSVVWDQPISTRLSRQRANHERKDGLSYITWWAAN